MSLYAKFSPYRKWKNLTVIILFLLFIIQIHVMWNDLPNFPEIQSFESTTDAWEFATDKIKEIFGETELKDCAIDLDEQFSNCGQTPLKFIGWKSI